MLPPPQCSGVSPLKISLFSSRLFSALSLSPQRTQNQNAFAMLHRPSGVSGRRPVSIANAMPSERTNGACCLYVAAAGRREGTAAAELTILSCLPIQSRVLVIFPPLTNIRYSGDATGPFRVAA